MMLTERGAGIVSIVVPDRNGVMGDVVLGYRDEESYLADGPCAGKIPGRFANRRDGGRFTLDGEDSGSILDHVLKLNASRWLATSEALIPTGELAPVEGTPMDFRTAKPIGRDIKADFPALKYGKGYDNCWVLDGAPGLKLAAELSSAVSGRRLEIWTDQPAAQVYTGNWLDGSPVSKSGRPYRDYDGVAIECQGFPDAPNHPGFPSCVLRPGETYSRTIIFKLFA